ncbi:hypothetical protein [Streptomyces sp. t39]|uniref:hypothetical protein n=1 Tax=Streptomyces sp. t39 TaxID=1828156 RepID=UPI00165065DF|nr:hypothetical protein [Streptomyces sp. t39]
MTPCSLLGHRWGEWSSQILECPDEDEIAVFEVHTRTCRVCDVVDAREDVLSCASW